jgi:hypothetical protein
VTQLLALPGRSLMLNSTPTIWIPVAKSDVQSSMTGSQGNAASFLQFFRYIHTDLLKSLSQKILLILLPSTEETLQEEEKMQKRELHTTQGFEKQSTNS